MMGSYRTDMAMIRLARTVVLGKMVQTAPIGSLMIQKGRRALRCSSVVTSGLGDCRAEHLRIRVHESDSPCLGLGRFQYRLIVLTTWTV